MVQHDSRSIAHQTGYPLQVTPQYMFGQFYSIGLSEHDNIDYFDKSLVDTLCHTLLFVYPFSVICAHQLATFVRIRIFALAFCVCVCAHTYDDVLYLYSICIST